MNETTNGSNPDTGQTEYRRHMNALETLAETLERDDLDPEQALAAFREADEHYRAVDAVLSRVEREIEDLHRDEQEGTG